MGLVAPHLYMLYHRLIKRCPASYLLPHLIHRSDLTEQLLDGTVEPLVLRILIDGKPFYCLSIPLLIVHEEITGHGTYGGVEMLVHELVGAGLEYLHHRTHQVRDKLIYFFRPPVQFLLRVSFRHLIGRTPYDLRRDAHAVGRDARMNAGIVEIYIFCGVKRLVPPEYGYRILPVHIVPRHIVQDRLGIGCQCIRPVLAVGTLGSECLPLAHPDTRGFGSRAGSQHILKIALPWLLPGPHMGLHIVQQLLCQPHAGVHETAGLIGALRYLRLIFRQQPVDNGAPGRSRRLHRMQPRRHTDLKHHCSHQKQW